MSSVPDPLHVKPWYLRNITEALALDDATGNVYVRTGFEGNIIISGNVNIPGTITVNSSAEDPVHIHLDEVGTSGVLDVPYLPVSVTGNIAGITGNVNVTQGTIPWSVSGNVNSTISSFPETSVTAFEEPLAVGITPLLQADSVYGLDPDFWAKTELNSGNITLSNSTWQVNSGTSAGGYARLATARYMTYQPGQGSMYRWTAAFTTTGGTTKDALGIDNIVQNTGPIDREDGYSFGYSGATDSDAHRKLGILHRRGGRTEIRQLTITTAPTGAQTATITLNGVAYTVSLTTSSSTEYTTKQIATLLKANSTVDNTWDIEACSNTITFSYYSPGAKSGTYSFSSTGSGTIAVAAFSQLVAGATPTDVWTYVDQWDNQSIQFDPTKLNVFGIDFRWLGAGRVRFFMENPANGKMVLVHTQVWSSLYTVPHMNNPSMRIIYRSGTTAGVTPSRNVVVTGASVFAGVQGVVNQTGGSQGYYNIDSSTRAKDTVWHLLSIQNPFVRSNKVNKSSLIIQDLTVSAQGNDPSIIFIVKNAVGTSDYLVFNPLPGASAFVFAQYSVSTVSETLSSDVISNIQTLGINGSSQFDLRSYNLTLSPGDTISVFISSTNGITRSGVAMTWHVD